MSNDIPSVPDTGHYGMDFETFPAPKDGRVLVDPATSRRQRVREQR